MIFLGAHLREAYLARVDLERDRLAFERNKLLCKREKKRIIEREERQFERREARKLEINNFKLMIAAF